MEHLPLRNENKNMHPTIVINDCLTVTIDGSKHTNDITSLHSQKHHGLIIVSRFVTGDVLVSYWPMFSLSQVTVLQFIRSLSMVVQVNVVLNRIVVIDSRWRFDNLCSSHLHSQSELYHVS